MKNLLLTSISVALLSMSGLASADQALAQKNACMTCHSVDKKVVGPGFKDVAKKYAGDKTAEAKLITKVKTGGKGVWGEIPMPPNPQVSDADAKKIVQWVLSLK
ncbi:MAG: c-type cytochrome [Thiobacillus sp.]